MTAFHDIGANFFEKTSLFDTAAASSMIADLKPVAAAVLAIFLIWRFIEVMIGSTKKPLEDTALEVMIWAIIWGFVFEVHYLSLVTDAMNEIYKWAGGGIGFFDNLDKWWEKLMKIADTLYAKDDSYVFPAQGVFALFIVGLAALIITGVPLIVVILSSLFMQLLIMIAPFMLLSLIFPAVRKMFYNWVEYYLFVVLTVLFISLIQKTMITKIDGLLNDYVNIATNADKGAIVGDSAILLLICVLFAVIMALAVPLARAISGASKSIGFGSGI